MGSNQYGQIGGEDPSDKLKPTLILESGVTSVSASRNYTLFQQRDGTLWELGNPGEPGEPAERDSWSGPAGFPYQITDPSPQAKIPFPTKIPVTGVFAFSAMQGGAMITKNDGTLWEMKRNLLGTPNALTATPQSSTPYKFIEIQRRHPKARILSVSSGNTHSILATVDGTAWTTGYSKEGARGYKAESTGTGYQDGELPYLPYRQVPVSTPYHTPQPTSNHLFRIQGNQLLTRQPLDFETQPIHKVQVAAINKAGVHITRTFTIQVEDVEE